MKRPVIGVVPLVDIEKESYWMLPGYMEGIRQAVKKPGAGLRSMAVSEDGLIEAVYVPDKSFVWSVQWHPEFAFRTDADSRKILKAFVLAANL